jgi:hypothetical protein
MNLLTTPYKDFPVNEKQTKSALSVYRLFAAFFTLLGRKNNQCWLALVDEAINSAGNYPGLRMGKRLKWDIISDPATLLTTHRTRLRRFLLCPRQRLRRDWR